MIDITYHFLGETFGLLFSTLLFFGTALLLGDSLALGFLFGKPALKLLLRSLLLLSDTYFCDTQGG